MEKEGYEEDTSTDPDAEEAEVDEMFEDLESMKD